MQPYRKKACVCEPQIEESKSTRTRFYEWVASNKGNLEVFIGISVFVMLVVGLWFGLGAIEASKIKEHRELCGENYYVMQQCVADGLVQTTCMKADGTTRNFITKTERFRCIQ